MLSSRQVERASGVSSLADLLFELEQGALAVFLTEKDLKKWDETALSGLLRQTAEVSETCFVLVRRERRDQGALVPGALSGTGADTNWIEFPATRSAISMASRLLLQLRQRSGHEAERPFLADRQWFRLVETMASAGTWEWDPSTRSAKWSEACFHLYGISAGPTVSIRSWLAAVHPEDRKRVVDLCRTAFRSEDLTDLEYRIVRDHQTRWINSKARLDADPASGRRRVVGISIDITQRKELDRQILNSQKLESLGVLAAGVAHDFNNCLQGILGNAGLALMDLPEESPLRELLQNVEQSALDAADLTSQLLAYAGQGRFELQKLDISRVVRQTARLIKASVGDQITLNYRLARDLPEIQGDPSRLRQVIINLIANASEAIGGQSGRIEVRTGTRFCDRSCLDEAYLKNDLPPGRYVSLSVSDTGPGFDRSTLEVLFDPFFSTKFLGRGLGLAAVLGIVRRHRSTIRVQSTAGKPTVFEILFLAEGLTRKRKTSSRRGSRVAEKNSVGS